MRHTVHSVYTATVEEVRDLDRRIKCLDACFTVISDEKMLDSVNYQLLALRRRRECLTEQLKMLHQK